jgi:alginate O-acetyltransferase complex protein AlgI
MLFTEFSFIFVFLPVTLLIYYSMPSVRLAIGSVVLASLVFYSVWNIYFVPMLLFAVVSNYLIARQLELTGRKAWFYGGIALALTPLFYFKYSGLFAHTAGLGFETGFFGEKLGSILPLGISFYTFQQILYLADVKAGKIKTAGLLEYAFFKLFFPQLIAGPIVHYRQLIPQIGQKIDREKMFVEGGAYFILGFIKKFFIADGFAAFADPIFDGAGPLGMQSAIFATLGYTLQLYFDFSGYSDMAMGLARLFGFELPWNFNSPYKAASIADFWRRWHMTLSQFLRDYVYIPLGGNRGGDVKRYRNLILTMLIGGLWHGAAWTFVLWGGLHGLALAVNQLWERHVRVRLGIAGKALTFVFVALMWVLFRATSFDRAMEVYRGLASFGPPKADQIWIWLIAGLCVCFFAPNSHQIVAFASGSRFRPLNFNAASLSKRLGVFSILSSGALLVLAGVFYSYSVDRWTYDRIQAPSDAMGMTNKSGDLRNNLWRKDIFSRREDRVAFVGSSFAVTGGRYKLALKPGGEPFAVTESLAMGGNGFIQGARTAAAIINADAVDVIVLAVSPLNFGSFVNSAAFPGECVDNVLTPELRRKFKIEERPLSSCAPAPFRWASLFQVFGGDRRYAAQFRNYLHNVVVSYGTKRNGFAEFVMDDSNLDASLQGISKRLSAMAADKKPVGNTQNGADKKFLWFKRQIAASLQEHGEADEIFADLKRKADASGIVLVVYETPTVKNASAPQIYPAGFFEDYQFNVRASLKRNGIPYLDLSNFAPWSGAAMADFIHSQFEVRDMVFKTVLAWLYSPGALKKSGLAGHSDVPEISGIQGMNE